MQETPMLFPITPTEFWKQIRTTIDEVVAERLSQQSLLQTNPHLPEKALLKATDVCKIFQVSRPTLYEWLKQKKLKSFKIKSRRYFSRTDIEAVINGKDVSITRTRINHF
ncbi:MAG: helix-turn-helix domain-containing protein [Bacteroidota bacterium]|nr:helix-turn-helix domain-containing protein [Bacteroidota bacterium]